MNTEFSDEYQRVAPQVTTLILHLNEAGVKIKRMLVDVSEYDNKIHSWISLVVKNKDMCRMILRDIPGGEMRDSGKVTAYYYHGTLIDVLGTNR